MQAELFSVALGGSQYRPVLTACENRKGVLDVDTVKGCSAGMAAHPGGGCYGACYAAKTAALYKRDFNTAVSRKPGFKAWRMVWQQVRDFYASWYRVGTAGDPSHDWENTATVCELLKTTGKRPVIITKHWLPATEAQLSRLKACGAVINTSVSALDTEQELRHRLGQMERVNGAGIPSVARVVTCAFGETEAGAKRSAVQAQLLRLRPMIDNPLRVSEKDPRVQAGELSVFFVPGAVGGGKRVSLHSKGIYLGACKDCPDQCGISLSQ